MLSLPSAARPGSNGNAPPITDIHPTAFETSITAPCCKEIVVVMIYRLFDLYVIMAFFAKEPLHCHTSDRLKRIEYVKTPPAH